jgi:hypothetical protein
MLDLVVVAGLMVEAIVLVIVAYEYKLERIAG